jgi:hypothetical protein
MHSRALSLPQSNIIATWDGLVDYTPIVPECYRTWRPFPANSEVVCLKEVFSKESENVVRLLAI